MQSLFFFLRPSLLIPYTVVLGYAVVIALVAIPLLVVCFVAYRKFRDRQQAKRDHAAHLQELQRLRAHSWEFENPTRPNDMPDDYYPEHWDVMVECVNRGISPGDYWRYLN